MIHIVYLTIFLVNIKFDERRLIVLLLKYLPFILRPVKGDWIQFLKKDFELIGEEVNEKLAGETTKNDCKNIFKSKTREEVFNIIKRSLGTHTKV